MQPGTQSNETRSPARPVPNFHDVPNIYTPSQRRPLADVSPNVKPVTPSATPGFLKRPLTGSPLKRSFNAAMESGEGLMYLKRRRLGENEVLSEVGAQREREASMEIGVQPVSHCGTSLTAFDADLNSCRLFLAWSTSLHQPSQTLPLQRTTRARKALLPSASRSRHSSTTMLRLNPPT